METAIVTGGLGSAGRWVLDRLNGPDRPVVCIDLETPTGAGPGGTVVHGIELRRGRPDGRRRLDVGALSFD